MRISVIMQVNLGSYSCAVTRNSDNSEVRFMQAVKSFLNQSFKDTELIIVSDGDRRVEDIWAYLWANESSIRFKYIDKQEAYSGEMRNVGIGLAQGDIICYLDHDDVFGRHHLQVISDNFNTEEYDWVYYDDYLVNGTMAQKIERPVHPEFTSIGTSAIAHRRNIEIKWGGGYGHDWYMIEKYLLPLRYIKIPTPEYYVCHFRKIEDFQ